MKGKNIVLIGMPGAGKSTIGPLLSNSLNMKYIDIDTIISDKENKSPRDIVNEYGVERFLEIQEKSVLKLHLENYVIATGGSIVYSGNAMEHLKTNGITIYLEVSLKDIVDRMDKKRRLARSEGESIENIYIQRSLLYDKYADIKVLRTGKDVNMVLDEILNELVIG